MTDEFKKEEKHHHHKQENPSLVGATFIKYFFIAVITIVILFFIVSYILPLFDQGEEEGEQNEGNEEGTTFEIEIGDTEGEGEGN
ncbi:hypothetical protein QA612_15280 [Evansella sp. AB-P1]|uniref:hypothetical protein n=1 Tax=Evansella sp. AB-P1 TaxID=3037653 RepID=UPI00241DF19E|nr:hypothetical protein [Evansella sp. AB-P1]MDG5788833.1 hypothetical protein [Evansella sp. AB-P1]